MSVSEITQEEIEPLIAALAANFAGRSASEGPR